MTFSNYNERAELYLGSDTRVAQEQGPRSFPTVAHAIRFAVEQAAPVSLRGALLRTGSTSLTGDALVKAYRSKHYPLPRKAEMIARSKH
jgi:hypothetical protein